MKEISMKRSDSFPIGTYAWVKKVIKNSLSKNEVIKVLIIGSKNKIRAFAVPEPFCGFKCSELKADHLNIDSKYIDTLIDTCYIDYLSYDGAVCKYCLEQYDHLLPTQQFICWQCEIKDNE